MRLSYLKVPGMEKKPKKNNKPTTKTTNQKKKNLHFRFTACRNYCRGQGSKHQLWHLSDSHLSSVFPLPILSLRSKVMKQPPHPVSKITLKEVVAALPYARIHTSFFWWPLSVGLISPEIVWILPHWKSFCAALHSKNAKLPTRAGLQSSDGKFLFPFRWCCGKFKRHSPQHISVCLRIIFNSGVDLENAIIKSSSYQISLLMKK